MVRQSCYTPLQLCHRYSTQGFEIKPLPIKPSITTKCLSFQWPSVNIPLRWPIFHSAVSRAFKSQSVQFRGLTCYGGRVCQSCCHAATASASTGPQPPTTQCIHQPPTQQPCDLLCFLLCHGRTPVNVYILPPTLSFHLKLGIIRKREQEEETVRINKYTDREEGEQERRNERKKERKKWGKKREE